MKIFRPLAAIFVIAGMTIQGLAQSWLWFITLTVFLFAWIFLEKYLEEKKNCEFWQDISERQYNRHREN
jgi:uncharacterized membrane protein